MSSKKFARFSMFIKLRASIIDLVHNGHLSSIYIKPKQLFDSSTGSYDMH